VPSALSPDKAERAARSHDRWVINKIRALCSWYSKGLDGGSQLRVRVNSAESLTQLRDIIGEFFFAPVATL
jgi:tRNA-dihydrouridine synthase